MESRKDKEMYGKYIFMDDTNDQMLGTELFISSFNRVRNFFLKNNNLRIKNIHRAYQENILSLADKLKKYDINYFGSEFYLRTQYEAELIKLLDQGEKKEYQLMDVVNKTKSLVDTSNVSLEKLKESGILDLYLGMIIVEINNIYKEIKGYKLEDHLEEILVDKYYDESLTRDKKVCASLLSLDTLQLSKMGLGVRVLEIKPKIIKTIKQNDQMKILKKDNK